MIAFFPSLGWQEMLLLLVIGLLLYGRNLPEAGRSLGRVAAQMKRGFQEFKDQMDRDGNLREVKKTFQETTGELRRISEVPRALANPAGAMRDLANEAMSSPMPDAKEPDADAGSSDAGAANAGTSDADASQAGKQPSAPTGS
ncbi:MAG TPA: twin-arginine translocase TatA/TatE family subunit [Planctomycetota bacterium]|nr:twin-arginine translocase TatA/TatE family subunit [Planctomycetota bacterium]